MPTSWHSVTKMKFPDICLEIPLLEMATNEKAVDTELGAQVVKKLNRAHELGQAIVGLRKSIVQLDQRRATLRQTGHAISRSKDPKQKTMTVICEDLMVEYPNEYLKKSLGEDVKTLDKVIEEKRQEVKDKLNELLRLQGDKDLQELGYDLRPLTVGEDE